MSRRLSILGLLLLAALAPVACRNMPPADAPSYRAEPRSTELSVMSFNIRYGTAKDGDDAWPHRREQVIDVIRRQDPDVVGLQEALRFQLDEIRAALPEYGEIGVGRDDGAEAGEYAAILYRRGRFLADERGTAWLSDTPNMPGSTSWGNEIPRIVTWVRLFDANSERGVYVYNVHLDHRSQPSRRHSVEMLLMMLEIRDRKDSPVIVLGDFNAGEQSAEIGAMREGGLVDAFRALHPDDTGVGTFNRFEGRTDGDKIDYVFVTPEITALDAAIVRDHVGERYPSDHFPVTARLRVGGR